MTQKFTLLLAVAMFCMGLLNAQNPSFVGFSDTRSVYDLAVTNDAYWAATDGGLLRYDRLTEQTQWINRTVDNLPLLDITSVAVGPQGTVWAGSSIGLLRQLPGSTEWELLNPASLDINVDNYLTCRKVRSDGVNGVWVLGRQGHFYHYDGTAWSGMNEEVLFGTTENAYDFDVRANDGRLWVQIGDAFFLTDGVTATEWGFSSQLPEPSGASIIYDWALDHSGNLWFITGNHLGIPVNGSWDLHTLPEWYNCVAPDHQGGVWLLAESDSKLSRRDSNGVYTHWSDQPYLDFKYYLDMGTDMEGMPIVLSDLSGWYRFEDQTFQSMPTATSGIPNNRVVDFAVGGNQTVWTVFDENLHWGWTSGYDIARFENGTWTDLTDTQVGDNHFLRFIRDIATDGQGRLWAAAYQRLFHFDGYHWHAQTVPEMMWGQLTSVAVSPADGSVWVGGFGAIGRRNSDGTIATVPIPDYTGGWSVDVMAIDTQGNVWLTTGDNEGYRISRYDGASWTHFYLQTLPGLEFSYYVSDIALAPNGNIWLVTDWGVAYYDGSAWHSVTQDYPFMGHYSAIAFDGETVWIGCYYETCFTPLINLALLRLENNILTLFPYTDYPLPYPNITALAVDGFHNVWIGGEYGGITVMNYDGVVISSGEPSTSIPALSVYPNPASNELTFVTNDLGAGEQVWTLYALDGREVMQQHWSGNSDTRTINLPVEITEGMYFWRIWYAEGEHTGKVFIQRKR